MVNVSYPTGKMDLFPLLNVELLLLCHYRTAMSIFILQSGIFKSKVINYTIMSPCL